MLSRLFGFSADRSVLKRPKASNIGCKNPQTLKTVQLPPPKQVRIHMDQNKEATCVPVVKKGDEVKIGQVIAEHNEFPTFFIHASISGKVAKIEDVLLENGIRTKEITIDADDLQTVDEAIKSPLPLIGQKQDLIAALEKSGINELNSADFLNAVSSDHQIDTLLVNATTWEPFVGTPIREILEHPDDVLNGILALMRYLNIEKGVIGIEENQTDSIIFLKDVLEEKGQDYANILVKPLPASYPEDHGLDRLLIQNCQLSVNSTLVLCVTTVGSLARYLETGMPLITMGITVNGSAVRDPRNVVAPIGTSIKDLIKCCGGYKRAPRKILYDGPLMGTALLSEESTISKQTTAVFALDEKNATFEEESECIRCGRCVDICPAKLLPISIDKAVRFNQLDDLENLNVFACTQCGSCSFICPASRHLVQTIQIGKTLVKNTTSDQELDVVEEGAELDG